MFSKDLIAAMISRISLMPALLKAIKSMSVGAIVQDKAGANTLPPSDINGGCPAGLLAGGAFLNVMCAHE